MTPKVGGDNTRMPWVNIAYKQGIKNNIFDKWNSACSKIKYIVNKRIYPNDLNWFNVFSIYQFNLL